MNILKPIAQMGLLMLGLMLFAQGCVGVVEPREGYLDRDHHRWYHEHAWVACGGPEDAHCR
jgi:hypothetical protein